MALQVYEKKKTVVHFTFAFHDMVFDRNGFPHKRP